MDTGGEDTTREHAQHIASGHVHANEIYAEDNAHADTHVPSPSFFFF